MLIMYTGDFSDFTSDGTPVGVAAGNLWLVRLATFILQPMEHTNHKFPAATARGIPYEVKSTVHTSGHTAGTFVNKGHPLNMEPPS